MLYSRGVIRMTWADPVLRNVATQIGELQIGFLFIRCVQKAVSNAVSS